MLIGKIAIVILLAYVVSKNELSLNDIKRELRRIRILRSRR